MQPLRRRPVPGRPRRPRRLHRPLSARPGRGPPLARVAQQPWRPFIPEPPPGGDGCGSMCEGLGAWPNPVAVARRSRRAPGQNGRPSSNLGRTRVTGTASSTSCVTPPRHGPARPALLTAPVWHPGARRPHRHRSVTVKDSLWACEGLACARSGAVGRRGVRRVGSSATFTQPRQTCRQSNARTRSWETPAGTPSSVSNETHVRAYCISHIRRM